MATAKITKRLGGMRKALETARFVVLIFPLMALFALAARTLQEPSAVSGWVRSNGPNTRQ